MQVLKMLVLSKIPSKCRDFRFKKKDDSSYRFFSIFVDFVELERKKKFDSSFFFVDKWNSERAERVYDLILYWNFMVLKARFVGYCRVGKGADTIV